jgi:hypothetical protein
MTDQQHNLQTMHAMPTMQTMPTTMHGMQPMQTMDTMRAVQTARELFLLLSGENVSGLRLARVRALAATLAFPATVIANARVVVNAQVVAPPRREKRFMVTADPWREPPTQRPKVNLPPGEFLDIEAEKEGCIDAVEIWQETNTVKDAKRVWRRWGKLVAAVEDAGGPVALPSRERLWYRNFRKNRLRMELCCKHCFAGDHEAFFGHARELTLPPNVYCCFHD